MSSKGFSPRKAWRTAWFGVRPERELISPSWSHFLGRQQSLSAFSRHTQPAGQRINAFTESPAVFGEVLRSFVGGDDVASIQLA